MHALLIILLLMVIALSIFTNRRSLIEGNKKKRKQDYKQKVKKDARDKRKNLKQQKKFATGKMKKRIKRRQKKLKDRLNNKLTGDSVQYKSMKHKKRNEAKNAAQEADRALELKGNLDEYFDQNFEGRLLDDINFWKTFALTQNTQGMDEWVNLDRAERSTLLKTTYDDAVRPFT